MPDELPVEKRTQRIAELRKILHEDTRPLDQELGRLLDDERRDEIRSRFGTLSKLHIRADLYRASRPKPGGWLYIRCAGLADGDYPKALFEVFAIYENGEVSVGIDASDGFSSYGWEAEPITRSEYEAAWRKALDTIAAFGARALAAR